MDIDQRELFVLCIAPFVERYGKTLTCTMIVTGQPPAIGEPLVATSLLDSRQVRGVLALALADLVVADGGTLENVGSIASEDIDNLYGTAPSPQHTEESHGATRDTDNKDHPKPSD